MNRIANTGCSTCQKLIYRRPSQIKSGQVFCSIPCSAKSQQKDKQCKICNKQYLGNKKTCSRACANTVRNGMTYTRENTLNKSYQGKQLKEKLASHRGGICEKCNESNYAILQIHHKKERHAGGDDCLSNLELLCPNCHMTHHLGYSLYKKKKML